MKVFYIQSAKYYQPADVLSALKCAEAAAKQTTAEVKVLLEPGAADNVFAGVDDGEFDGTSCKYDTISGEITTPRKYKNTMDEIVISICPTKQILEKIQKSEHVLAAIIIPDNPQDDNVYHWLDLYTAVDIQNGSVLNGIGQPAEGIRRAVGFLQNYSLRYTVKLTDIAVWTGEIADVANTIKKQGIVGNFEEGIATRIPG